MIAVNQLRAFAAVVEIGTVTGASAALGRTQPQVSRLVSSLEDAVGFELFVRERKRLLLTQRGARLYDEVKHTLDNFENIAHVAERIRDDAESGISILAPAYIAHTILPLALAKFRIRFPKRYFSVEIAARNAMGSWLPFHSFDMGIAALPFELAATKVRRFASVQTVVVVPKLHPLTRKRVITLKDIAGSPFVATNRNTGIRSRLQTIFDLEGIKPTVVGETTNSISACDMVARGMGITIQDAFVPLAAAADLIEIRTWKPGLTTEFGFIYPANGPISENAGELSSMVSEVVREFGSALASKLNA